MKFSSGHSINSRAIEAQLSPSQCGYAFMRFIHLIVALRLKFPTARMLLNKFDFKSACRRVQNDPEAIAHGMVTLGDLCGENIALASLRLTFGGKPCPSTFSELSEATCDLANAIARIAPWDIRNDIPTHASILQDPIFLENDIPLAPALPLLVDPCVDKHGGSEVFIDDTFSAFLDLSQDHIDRGQFSPLLAIETLSRPSHPNPNCGLLTRWKAAFAKGYKTIGDLKMKWAGFGDYAAPKDPSGNEICLKCQLTGEHKTGCGRSNSHLAYGDDVIAKIHQHLDDCGVAN